MSAELPPLPRPIDLLQTIYGDRDRPIGDFYPAASVRAWGWAVRRAALEEAARVCDQEAAKWDALGGYRRNDWEVVPQEGCDECAAAIRALAEPVTLPVPPVAP